MGLLSRLFRSNKEVEVKETFDYTANEDIIFSVDGGSQNRNY